MRSTDPFPVLAFATKRLKHCLARAAAMVPTLVPTLAALLTLAGCAGPVKRQADVSVERVSDEIVILISIDGMPADFLGTGAAPTVDAIATEGARATWMTPSQPTLTFPNHYTLVTGLRPDRHGIVHNRMRDDTLGQFVSKEQSSATDSRWWGGEPIWATLQKQGGIAATMFWPGSEARIAGELPRYRRAFDGSVTPEARTDQVLAWLDLPAEARPQFLTLYFEQYDVAAHETSTRSMTAMNALRDIDAAIARLREGLRMRGLLAKTNLVVVSDHGMADVPHSQRLWLDDMLDPRHYEVDWWGTFVGLRPKPEQTEIVERAFLGRHPHFECWRKHETPAQWHFGRHPRVSPIVCQMDTGWGMQDRAHALHGTEVRGEHGFEMDDPTMRSVFVASGPALCRGVELTAFDNIDLYSFLARLLRLRPAETDGRIDALLPALRQENQDCRN
jgi:predicted AlkP superfamily pyrophosphatase or phosphodiesterase